MDDIRDSLSRMKKKLKYPLRGGKRKPDGAGASADPTDSLPQQEPHVVAGDSHDRQGNRADEDGEQDFPMDQRPQPDEPESASVHGSENDQEGSGEADVGVEAGRRRPFANLGGEVAVGGGPKSRGRTSLSFYIHSFYPARCESRQCESRQCVNMVISVAISDCPFCSFRQRGHIYCH